MNFLTFIVYFGASEHSEFNWKDIYNISLCILDNMKAKKIFFIVGILKIRTRLYPSSIYSCSIGHIWEHEFCHLGCWAALWAVSEKFLKQQNFCLSMLLFGVVFSCFCGQKNSFNFFFYIGASALKSCFKKK